MCLLVCSLVPTALVDGSSWRMMLNVGRVDESAMPASWAASGGRLLLPLGVRFDGGRAQPSDGAVKFVGPRGEESVAVEESDGWHATEKNFLGESELRFSLQIGGARRNDVSLPPGRYFFRARCWDDETLPDAEEQVAELEREVEALSRRIDACGRRLQRQGPLLGPARLCFSLLAGELCSLREQRFQKLLTLKSRRSRLPDGGARGLWHEPSLKLRVAKQGQLLMRRSDAWLHPEMSEATWRAAARLVLPPVRRHWRLAGGDDFAIVGTFSWAPSADTDA